MAPKQTAQAKAARLQMKGLEMSVKADYITVCHALKNRPDVVSEVKKQLKALGVLNADDEVVENAAARPALGKVDVVKQETGSPAGKGGAEEIDWDRDIGIKSDMMSFGAHELSSILAALEPATYSKNNQKSMVKKGCKHPPKNVCLEVIEYCTEQEPVTSLGRGKKLGMIRDRLVELNTLGGRRARDFQYPINWEAVGFFGKVKDGNSIYIVYRLSAAQVKIPEAGEDVGLGQIEVLSNFSKARAMVSVNGEQLKISDLFAAAGQPLPSLRFMPGVQVKRASSDMAAEVKSAGSADEAEAPLTKLPKMELAEAPPVTPKKAPTKAEAVKAAPEEPEPVSPADEAAGMAQPVRSPLMAPAAPVKDELDQDALATAEASFQPMVS